MAEIPETLQPAPASQRFITLLLGFSGQLEIN
jgi:hypothetical protein